MYISHMQVGTPRTPIFFYYYIFISVSTLKGLKLKYLYISYLYIT